MKPFAWTSLILLCSLSIWACESSLKPSFELNEEISTPQMEAPPQRSGGGISPMLRPPEESDQCEAHTDYVSPIVIRRLTRTEYRNTARSLFGIDLEDLVEGFPPEEEVNGFDNQSKSLQVSALHVEQYMNAAERLSLRALDRFDEISPCIPMEEEAERCVSSFIESFGLRAWRRPLSGEEIDQLLELYRVGVAGAKEDMVAPQAHILGPIDPIQDGLSLVINALLQSPNFLYRVERGAEVMTSYQGQSDREEGEVKELTQFELASRLSYLLWRDMPDDELFDAALRGQLATEEGLMQEAERMLLDPKSSEGLWSFFEQWLAIDEVQEIDKDPSIFPTYQKSLNELMESEVRLFIEDVVFEKRDMRKLFSSSQSFMNAPLAAHYARGGEGAEIAPHEVVLSEEWAINVDPSLSEQAKRNGRDELPSGESFTRVMLNPTRRSGIMTRGAILSLTTKPNMGDPVHRGLYIRERLLCTPLPPPPPDIVVVAPDPDPSLTTREQFAIHSAEPACEGCHKLVDPLGFGLENFDPLGRFRNLENGKEINDRGEIVSTLDIDGPFEGSQELGDRLANSEQVQRCVVLNLMRYSNGRSENRGELCDIDRLYTQYQESGFDFLTLLRSIIRSPNFRQLHIDREQTLQTPRLRENGGE